MALELIRELHEVIRDKSKAQRALDEAGIDFDLGDQGEDVELTSVEGDDFVEDDEFTEEENIDPELERIADQYCDQAEEMDDDDLMDAIGDDLEQLDYSPEEIANGIDTVMGLLGREVDDGEDQFDDEEGLDDEEGYEPDFDEDDDEGDFSFDRMT